MRIKNNGQISLFRHINDLAEIKPEVINSEDAGKLIQKLRVKIWFHRYLYYIKNCNMISDLEYDQLEKDLKKLETTYSEHRSLESPTERVGYNPPEYLDLKIKNMTEIYIKEEEEKKTRFKPYCTYCMAEEGVKYNEIEKCNVCSSCEALYCV